MKNTGSKFEIGKVTTDFKKLNKKDLLIKTTVRRKQSPEAWIDSTIVKISDFQPVYYPSFNSMRNRSIRFDKNKATGYYLDKKTQKLPRSEKKKLSKQMWFYPADEKGNSLAAFPHKYKEDYEAMQQGIVQNILDKNTPEKRESRKRENKELDNEIYVSDEELTK